MQYIGRCGQVLATLLLLCATGCATYTPHPARTTLPVDTVSIAMRSFGGIPGFAADEADDSSSVFLVDTGAAAVIVTPRFAAARGASIRNNPGLTVRDALGRKRKPRIARFRTLTIRGATFHDVDAFVDEMTSLRQGSDRVDALLGQSLFKDVLLTIDYPRRRITIESGALPPVDGQDVLPLIRSLDGSLLVPIGVGVREAWMVLDTGHTVQGLHLLPDRVDGLAWATRPVQGPAVQTMFGETASIIGRLAADAQIGRHLIRRPIVCMVKSTDQEFLGSDVLSHFAVTLDQKNDRIRFARAGDSPIEIPGIQTLGFILDARGRVSLIVPNTFAERRGLRVGDHVTAVEGVSLDQLRTDGWAQLRNHRGPLRLTIVRDHKEMELPVEVTTLVR